MSKQKSQTEQTYLSLIEQKKQLQAQLSEMSSELDGLENPEIAQKINELELEKAKLTKECESTENNAKTLKEALNSLKAKITNLSDGKNKELIVAVQKQRWFFFKEPKEIIFDTHTGMIWENLDYFNSRSSKKRNEIINEVKSIKTANQKNWEIPIYDSLLVISDAKNKYPFLKQQNLSLFFNPVASRNKPYYGDYYYCSIILSNKEPFYEVATKSDLDTYKDYNYTFFNRTFYNQDLDPTNTTIYSLDEKNQMVLDIFSSQKWIPLFDDRSLTDVFVKLYYERPALLEKFAELEVQIKEIESKRNTLDKDFDFKVPLREYDLKEINYSALQYYKNAVYWINDLLDSLDDFEKENLELIQSMSHIQIETAEDYKPDSDFSDDENSFFEEQKLEIKKIFDFGFDTLKKQLVSFRKEAEDKKTEIDSISNSDNKISFLAKIDKEPRPDFYLFAEYTGNLIKEKMQKFNWFYEKNELIKEMLKKATSLQEDYDIFKDKLKGDFIKKCEEQSIENKRAEEWFEEWTKERFTVVSKQLLLLTSGLPEMKLQEETILSLNSIAEEYKKELDEFYLEERINIHTKFAFNNNGEFQEKFEKENLLFKIAYKYSSKIEDVIFKLESSSEKIFIIRWAKEWLNSQIEEIVHYIEKSKIKDTTPVFVDSLKEIKRLQLENMEVYLSDVKQYSDAVKKRHDDFNALIFKMRKEIEGKSKPEKKK
ncbi:MAG: hypothetical protein PHF33_05085 [Candidatus Delongbacteria bacterium]|jgi:hypothetical protein|nr:hypothetical protein [Candidatus Delongbacteria bacterium]MDD4205018.1 hypothetical protein [Candidatus Delongbacteria bacterium]MDY0017718.1 hypothetical protein [Candidatus Delongbacteria bacterium]